MDKRQAESSILSNMIALPPLLLVTSVLLNNLVYQLDTLSQIVAAIEIKEADGLTVGVNGTEQAVGAMVEQVAGQIEMQRAQNPFDSMVRGIQMEVNWEVARQASSIAKLILGNGGIYMLEPIEAYTESSLSIKLPA